MDKEEIRFLKYVCSNAGHSMNLKNNYHLVLTSGNDDSLEVLLGSSEPEKRDLFELYNRRPRTGRKVDDSGYTLPEAHSDLLAHYRSVQNAMRDGEWYNNAFAPSVITWTSHLKKLQELAQAQGTEIEGARDWRDFLRDGYETALNSLGHIEEFQREFGDHHDVERELYCATYMLGRLIGEIDSRVETKVRELFQRDMFVDGEYKDPKLERVLRGWPKPRG